MKKLLTVALSLCLALCAMLALTACTTDVKGKYYTYYGLEGVGITLTQEQKDYIDRNLTNELRKHNLKFKDEGKGEIWTQGSVSDEFTWTQEGDQVTITMNSDYKVVITAKGSHLYWEYDFTNTIVGGKVNVLYVVA